MYDGQATEGSSSLKERVEEIITSIIYKNSTDNSEGLVIKYENIQKVISLLIAAYIYDAQDEAVSPSPKEQTENELLPCPFCGGKAYWAKFEREGKIEYQVLCLDILSSAPPKCVFAPHNVTVMFATLDEAIKSWNTRANIPNTGTPTKGVWWKHRSTPPPKAGKYPVLFYPVSHLVRRQCFLNQRCIYTS